MLVAAFARARCSIRSPTFVYYRLAAIARGVRADRGAARRAVRARRGRDRARDRGAPPERRVPRAAEQPDRHAVAHGLRARARGAPPRHRDRLRRGVLRVQRPAARCRTSPRTRTSSSCARCRRSAWRACASASRSSSPRDRGSCSRRCARRTTSARSISARPSSCSREARDVVRRRARPRSSPSARGSRRRSRRCPASRCSRARRTSCSCGSAPAARARSWQALADAGILVRNFDRPGPLAGCLRITVGTPGRERAAARGAGVRCATSARISPRRLLGGRAGAGRRRRSRDRARRAIALARSAPARHARRARGAPRTSRQLELLGVDVRAHAPSASSSCRRSRCSARTFASAHRVALDDPNLVVRFGPPGKALLVMAHYDTVAGSPGAVDNAAAVALLVELARVLREHPPPQPVMLAFTANEEIGLVGAEALADQARRRDRVRDRARSDRRQRRPRRSTARAR